MEGLHTSAFSPQQTVAATVAVANDAVSNAIQALSTSHHQLSEQLVRLQEEHAQLLEEAQMHQQRSKVTTTFFESQLRSKENHIARLQRENGALTSDCDHVVADFNRAMASIQQLNYKQSDLIETISNLQSDDETNRARIDELEQENHDLHSQIDHMTNQSVNTNTTIQNALTQHASITAPEAHHLLLADNDLIPQHEDGYPGSLHKSTGMRPVAHMYSAGHSDAAAQAQAASSARAPPSPDHQASLPTYDPRSGSLLEYDRPSGIPRTLLASVLDILSSNDEVEDNDSVTTWDCSASLVSADNENDGDLAASKSESDSESGSDDSTTIGSCSDRSVASSTSAQAARLTPQGPRRVAASLVRDEFPVGHITARSPYTGMGKKRDASAFDEAEEEEPDHEPSEFKRRRF